MTQLRVTLKRDLGDGGAWLDQSNGSPSHLHQVLKALVQDSNVDVTARQATIATGVIGSYLVKAKDKTKNVPQLTQLDIHCEGPGTATNTVVQVRVNGTVKGTATVVAAATGAGLTARAVISPAIDLFDQDLVDLNVSTAPTGGTGLTAVARIRSVIVE